MSMKKSTYDFSQVLHTYLLLVFTFDKRLYYGGQPHTA